METGTSAWIRKLFGEGRWLVALVLLPAFCFLLWQTMISDQAKAWGIFIPLNVTLIEPGETPTATKSMETALVVAAAHRLYSVASTTLLVFVSIGVGAYGWRSVWRSPKSRLDRRMIWGLSTVLFLLVLRELDGNWILEEAGLLHRPTGHVDQVYRFLGDHVFERAIGTFVGGNALALLKWQFLIGNNAIALAAIGVVVSSAFIAIRAARLGAATDGPAAAELKNQLDMTLMIAAMLLVAGVIDTNQWTVLPVPFIAEEMRAAYASMINGFVALESVCFVGVLVSIFLPSALLLERARGRIRQARSGEVEARSPPAPEAKAEGLAFADLIRVVALLAPVLAGPVATFVNIKLPV
jgi:hypothetical protein